MKKITLILVCCLGFHLGWAQQVLHSESFETDGNGTRYSTSVAEFTDSGTDYFLRTDGTDISANVVYLGGDGAFFFAAQDIDGEVSSATQTLTISGIDIANASDMSFRALFAEDDATDGNEDWDDSDSFIIEYQIDGSGYQNLFAIAAIDDGDAFNQPPGVDTDFDGVGDGAEISPTFTQYGNTIVGTGASLDIRITFNLNAGDEDIAVDKIEILGTLTATPDNVLISEFEPNPTGTDPANVYVELKGAPGTEFSGWILGLESDGANGTVDRSTEVSGTFDANGLLVVSVPDFENPSFTIVLCSTFDMELPADLDADDDGSIDDVSALGTVYDALNIPDTTSDAVAVSYGSDLGGADFAFTGDEPRLVFREGSTGDWYAINDPDNDEVYDLSGSNVGSAVFDMDPTAGTDTFGAINPALTDTPTVTLAIVATDAIKAEGDSGTVDFVFTVTRSGDTSGTNTVDYTVGGDVNADDFGGILPSGTVHFAANETNKDLVVSVTGDTDVEADENFVVTLSNPSNDATITTPTANGTITNDDTASTAITLIHDIQGTEDENLMNGLEVTVEAIVVGDFQDGDTDTGRDLRGFYIQEEDADIDANDQTSEGLFVFEGTGNFITNVAMGDKVRVTGTVTEYFGETQLGSVSNITIVSAGNTLPSPVNITLPSAAVTLSQNGDYQPDLEAYEGMLVTFGDQLTVTEMFQLDRFNEIKLSQGGRLVQFTQTQAPSISGYQAHLQSNGARTITYDDGWSFQNADIGNLDGFGPTFSTATDIRMGDTVMDLRGVLSYQWAGNGASGATWRVRSVTNGDNIFVKANQRTMVPPDTHGRLKVVSLNVLNFFVTLDNTCGINGNENCRGADNMDEYNRQLQKLTTTIAAMDADIVGLVELENNPAANPAGDGADPVLEALINNLNATMGANTYEFVDAGVVGDDVIKVGMIYKPSTVVLAGNTAILDSNAFVDPNNTGTSRNRAALAQTFRELGTDEVFTVTVNHLKSKGTSNPAPTGADIDAGDGQGNWNDTRTKGVEALVSWLGTDPTASGDDDVLILGDLNAYAKEGPITKLEELGYTDLAGDYLGNNATSFVFEGQVGTLDYAFANAALKAQVTGTVEWHINADEPDAIDYNTDFGRDTSIFDGTLPYRASDHDPVLVGLDLEQAPAPVTIYINEVDADTPGTDAAEFVELYDGGVGNTSLDGLVVVFFNGSDDASYRAIDLDGETTNANGFFVLANSGVANVDLTFPGNALQNGADAVALYSGDATDFPNDTPATTINLVDAIGYDTNDGDDNALLMALGLDVQYNEDANGNKDAESNSRVPDGKGDFKAQMPTPGEENIVPVDTTPPVIMLLGENPLTLAVGNAYVEPGATAQDDVDGDLSGSIVIDASAVDTSVAGTYQVTYNVGDAAGNAATEVVRTVIVEEEPSSMLEVTRFVLVNADTDMDIAVLTDGLEVDISTLPTQHLDIRAEGNPDVESMQLSLSGVLSTMRTEDFAPYALYGDISGNYNGHDFVLGTYLVMATAYAGNSGQGESGIPLSIGFSLVDTSGGDTTPPVITLLGDNPLTLTVGGAYAELGATAQDDVDGDLSSSIVIDASSVDTSVAGTYQVTYNVSDTAGNAAMEVVRTVIVEEEPSNTLLVTRFVLVNADTDMDIAVLTNGMEIDISTLSTQHLDIRAEGSPDVESMELSLSGIRSTMRTESFAPYALYGDLSGDYNGHDFVVGTYTMMATPYAGNNGQGDRGETTSISFSLIEDTEPVPNLTVTRFVLVDADTNMDIMELSQGMEIDVLTLPTQHLDIRAEGTSDVESMKLSLSGALSAVRTENFAPYALYGDISGDYNGYDFVLGTYTVRATAYSENLGQGASGTPFSMDFSLMSNGAAKVSPRDSVVNQMNLHENPVKEVIRFDFDLPIQLRTIAMYDVHGRIVKEEGVDKRIGGGDTYELNVNTLEPGTYYLRATDTNGNHKSKKIIIR